MNEVKTIAHNWARKYMTRAGKPSRYNLMNEAEQRLFMYVRQVNMSMLTRLNKFKK